MNDQTNINLLKQQIEMTQESFAKNARLFGNDMKDRITHVKDNVENTAQQLQNTVVALSPKHQIQKHPLLLLGSLTGLGVYLGLKSGTSSGVPSKSEYRAAHTIIESIAFGIFASALGELVKKLFPHAETHASAAQSAILAKMTSRVVDGFEQRK